jgi:hypothetical protein
MRDSRNVNAMNLTFSAYIRVTGITAEPSIEAQVSLADHFS